MGLEPQISTLLQKHDSLMMYFRKKKHLLQTYVQHIVA